MRRPLTPDEITGTVIAVQSVFRKLQNLYDEIAPTFRRYGFEPMSAGCIARNVSENIEAAMVQHVRTFSRGNGHADLARDGQRWEVKVCKTGLLTINQSAVVDGENYIVVNYRPDTTVRRIMVLWNAQDDFFSARNPRSNARVLIVGLARGNLQRIDAPAPDPLRV